MAAIGSGAKICSGTTTSTTAETATLTSKVKQVKVTNHEAVGGDNVYVTVSTGLTSAEAIAGVVTAVALADENFCILPQSSKVVFKSPRDTYVSLSVVGNASPVTVEGTSWFD